MAALRLSTIVPTVLKRVRWTTGRAPVKAGPGCGCERCIDAWDRHHRPAVSTIFDREGALRPASD
jgi:hypothetical protein